MFPYPHCRYRGPTDGAGLIKLKDRSHNSVFPYPHCRYRGPTDGAGFNQIERHESQYSVSISSL